MWFFKKSPKKDEVDPAWEEPKWPTPTVPEGILEDFVQKIKDSLIKNPDSWDIQTHKETDMFGRALDTLIFRNQDLDVELRVSDKYNDLLGWKIKGEEFYFYQFSNFALEELGRVCASLRRHRADIKKAENFLRLKGAMDEVGWNNG